MQRKTPSLLPLNYFYWFVLIGFSITILVKSILVPVTNDEAYSFFLIKTNYWKALVGTANTHWLNSFFIRVFTWVFGDAPWAWRLQTVFAGIGYAWMAKKIAATFSSGLLQLICFVLLLFNPYVLDYFSMARGYGLSMFFILLSVYYLQQFLRSKKEQQLAFSLLALCAAVFSNYTSLYFLMGALLLLVLYLIQQKGGWLQGIFKSGLYTKVVLIAGATVLFAIANLFFIKYYTKDLEFGATHSFAADSLGSLIQTSSYNVIPANIAALLGAGLFLLILFVSVTRLRKGFKADQGPAVWIAAILMISIVLSILFFYLFHTPYLVERGMLVFYPLLVVLFCFTANEIKQARIQQTVSLILVFVAMLFVFNTGKNLQINSTLDWKENSDTRTMLLEIKKMTANNAPIIIGTHRVHYGVIKNYYQVALTDYCSYSFEFLSDDELALPTAATIKKIKTMNYVLSTAATDSSLYQTTNAPCVLMKIYPNGSMLLRVQKNQ